MRRLLDLRGGTITVGRQVGRTQMKREPVWYPRTGGIHRHAVLASLLLGGAMLTVVAYSGLAPFSWAARPTVRVGILHSVTGNMAISERPVVDATILAIEEINARGGVLGQQIEPVVADGRSDADDFGREAARLIDEEGVSVIFGCWTSASRRTVRPIIEQRQHLLFYPVQYEGVEQSPGIVHTGAAPNQQIIPAVRWSFEHLGASSSWSAPITSFRARRTPSSATRYARRAGRSSARSTCRSAVRR